MDSHLLKNTIELLAHELDNNMIRFRHIEEARYWLVQCMESFSDTPIFAEYPNVNIDAIGIQEESINSKKIIHDVRRLEGGLDLLFKMLRQRVISNEELTDKEDTAVNILKRRGLVMMIKAEDQRSNTSFFTLTGKGLLFMNNKDSRNKMKLISSRYTIPSWCGYSSKDVSADMLNQAIRLNEYYRQTGNTDYFIFSLPEIEHLLLACQIKENSIVQYECSPSILNLESRTQMIETLCTNEKLECLTIIEHSRKSMERVKSILDIEEKNNEKLKYYCLEDNNEQ